MSKIIAAFAGLLALTTVSFSETFIQPYQPDEECFTMQMLDDEAEIFNAEATALFAKTHTEKALEFFDLTVENVLFSKLYYSEEFNEFYIFFFVEHQSQPCSVGGMHLSHEEFSKLWEFILQWNTTK